MYIVTHSFIISFFLSILFSSRLNHSFPFCPFLFFFYLSSLFFFPLIALHSFIHYLVQNLPNFRLFLIWVYIHWFFCLLKYFFLKWYFKWCSPFHSQVFTSNTPFCLPHNSYDVTVENLILDQLIFPLLIFLLFSDHLCAWYCTDIVRRNSVLDTYGS